MYIYVGPVFVLLKLSWLCTTIVYLKYNMVTFHEMDYYTTKYVIYSMMLAYCTMGWVLPYYSTSLLFTCG